jgi:hypothetical protein
MLFDLMTTNIFEDYAETKPVPELTLAELERLGLEMVAVRSEFEAKEANMTKNYTELAGKVILEYNAVSEKDLADLAKLHELVSSLGNEENEREFKRIFFAVFKNMCSTTVDVLKREEGEERHAGVTVGKFGFGIKRDKVSRAIEKISEVELILQYKDAIIKSMNEHKNLWRWADKLERFAAIVGDTKSLKCETYIDVPLNNQVVFKEYRRMQYSKILRFSQGRSRYSRMQTSSFFALVYTDVGSSDVGNTSTKDINLTNRSNEDGAICYMQLRKELFERLPEFEETVTKAIAKPKQVFAQLRDSFGKEIMLVEV